MTRRRRGSSIWGEYVPVAQRRADAEKEMQKLRKKGKIIEPIEIEGRKIAKNFWGDRWCRHLESFSDYSNRLPRGRTYVRNGSVCHLAIKKGCVEAMVSGSSLYAVSIDIKTLSLSHWEKIKEMCSGEISSLVELLQGKLSVNVMKIVADHKEGLFPQNNEISFTCSCPDWASMCKHVAAVLYGIGSRLDAEPELLFTLRGVDAAELITEQLDTSTEKSDDLLEGEGLSDLFGIDLEDEEEEPKPKREAKLPVKRKKGAKEALKSSAKIKRLPKEGEVTGKQLIAFRKKRGLTVAELAFEIGVTPASIYRWEKVKGELKIHPRSLNAIREVMQR